MEDTKVKILCISGTPAKGGNCDTMVREAKFAGEKLPLEPGQI